MYRRTLMWWYSARLRINWFWHHLLYSSITSWWSTFLLPKSHTSKMVTQMGPAGVMAMPTKSHGRWVILNDWMFSFPHTDDSSAVLTRKLFPDCVLLVWLGYGSPYPDVMKGTGHWYVMHMQSRSRKPPSDLKSICLSGDSIPCFTSILNAFLEWSIDISQTNLFCVPQNALPRNVWDVKCLLIILGDSACVGSGVGAGSLVDDDVSLCFKSLLLCDSCFICILMLSACLLLFRWWVYRELVSYAY